MDRVFVNQFVLYFTAVDGQIVLYFTAVDGHFVWYFTAVDGRRVCIVFYSCRWAGCLYCILQL